MNIKELAEQAGYLPDTFGIGHWDMPECKRFAELVAAAEREACAKLCEECMNPADPLIPVSTYQSGAFTIAEFLTESIRQRGEK